MTVYNNVEIRNLIPHRYPFLLVDKVIAMDPEEGTLTAIKNVTANEPFFTGHFPVKPVMPGVLMVEALAQACGVLIVHDVPKDMLKKHLFYFAGIDKVRFKRMVEPGDQLELSVSVIKSRQNLWKFSGKATVDGVIACSGELTIVMGADEVDSGDQQ